VGRTEKHKYENPRRLPVIFDAHPKEFIGVKFQQTVFLTGLDKYIGSLHCTNKKQKNGGLVPLMLKRKY